MTKYAHIKDGSIYRIIDLTDDEVAAIPAHKTAYLLPYIAVARPAYDSATHRAPVRLPDEIQPTLVTQAWADPVAKTAEELNAEKDAAIDRFDVLAFKVLFDHENRTRALESKAPITQAQFRAALKARL